MIQEKNTNTNTTRRCYSTGRESAPGSAAKAPQQIRYNLELPSRTSFRKNTLSTYHTQQQKQISPPIPSPYSFLPSLPLPHSTDDPSNHHYTKPVPAEMRLIACLLLLLPVLYSSIDTFLPRFFIFDPARLQQLSQASIEKFPDNATLLMEDLQASLRAEYGDKHINALRKDAWFFK